MSSDSNNNTNNNNNQRTENNNNININLNNNHNDIIELNEINPYIQLHNNEEANFSENINNIFNSDNLMGLKPISYNNNFDTTIDEIYFNISSVIANEKNKLQSEKGYILKTQKDFKDFEAAEIAKMNKEKLKLKQRFKLVNGSKENDVLDLNIGGTHEITTTRSTLTKFNDSILAILFSGQQALTKKNDKIFLDREAEPFINVINYLRNGTFPVLKSINDEIKFYDELDYWKIPIYEGSKQTQLYNITYHVGTSNFNYSFDIEWCAQSLTLDATSTIVKKFSNSNTFARIDLQHGIVFCKPALDVYSVYIEFKITMNVSCKGKSHLFIGLGNKSKCQPENLTSKLLRDFPNCYLWDIWNTILIKTNEYGCQIRSVKGYGCQCENFETRIGMKYNHKSRSLAFYKNGIYLGVAFRNIPSGLTPCLDVWFDSGTIEIINNSSCQIREFL